MQSVPTFDMTQTRYAKWIAHELFPRAARAQLHENELRDSEDSDRSAIGPEFGAVRKRMRFVRSMKSITSRIQ